MTDTTTTDGNGTTHFFDVMGMFRDGFQTTRVGPKTIHLGNAHLGRAMLFIPAAVSVAEQVPMLVYYHGHHGPNDIEGYIRGNAARDFRPLLKSKKVVLVQPQGGPVSKFGPLGTPAGLRSLIERAMMAAFAVGRPPRKTPRSVPKPPALILAGFSGGGATLNNVVFGSKADYIDLLAEVWSFDSMYSGEGQKWVEWARASANAKKKLRVRVSTEVAGSSPDDQAAVVRKAAKPASAGTIDIDAPIESSHEGLPGKFIPQWL